MLGKKLSVGLGVLGAATASLCLFSSTAFADYGPGPNDVVGVGSDTVQAASNFVSDGSYTGSAGYNSAGNTNKVINFDATADANTRLAYGPQGVGTGLTAATNNCAPGTGGTAGTGNAAGPHTGDQPCTLNPTIIVRAGAAPIQRPNGSGAGYALLKADTDASGVGTGYVDYSRSSAAQNTDSATGVKNPLFDSITIGNDPLAMLKTSSGSNAVPLSATQLGSIYSCSSTALTWNQVGGTSSATIKPLLPQVGSGTRKAFLAAIGNPTPGTCVTNVEENDPEAIDASGDPTNAIEPMSGGRLNLFKGLRGDGSATGSNYFTDPSCPALSTAAACSSPALNPNVTLITTGTPSSGTLFNISRPLYIYFRHADLQSPTSFQPGGSLNWVRTLLANPCSGAGHTTGCVTISGITYGPGGAPYYASAAGQADVSVAGIASSYSYNTPAA